MDQPFVVLTRHYFAGIEAVSHMFLVLAHGRYNRLSSNTLSEHNCPFVEMLLHTLLHRLDPRFNKQRSGREERITVDRSPVAMAPAYAASSRQMQVQKILLVPSLTLSVFTPACKPHSMILRSVQA